MSGLDWPERVRAWDAAFAAIRGHLRGEGLREVSTPVRGRAVALEPFIEPVAAPPGFLLTSPELPMKRLLCRGSGPIFQIAHVFRRAEVGARHREEFHLLEWYRLDPAGVGLPLVLADVEALADRVFSATGREGQVPKRWPRVGFLDLVEATCGARLRGDEDAAGLLAALPAELAAATRAGLPARAAAEPLAAWVAFYTAWSDGHGDAWVAGRPALHLVDYPGPLAALSRRREVAGLCLADRAESYLFGVEIANGYVELSDPAEQRRRFEAVARLRAAYGAPALPLDEEFLAELSGLPPCVGMALGVDRLIMLASGRESLEEVSLALGGV